MPLRDDRGWTHGGPEPPPLRENDLRRNVVLPYDAEETGQEHEWAVFVERLAAAGVAIGEAALRRLP